MSRYISIDLDANRLYVAAGSSKGGASRLEKAFSIPLSGPLTTANAEEYGQTLAESLRANGISPAPLLIALGRDRLILKEVKIPNVGMEDEPNLVRFQATKEFTEPLDTLVIDYYTLDRIENDGQKRAIVVAVKKDYLKSLEDLAKAARMRLVLALPRSIALYALTQKAIRTGEVSPPDEKRGSIAIYSRGELVVVRDDQVVFSRPVSAASLSNDQMLMGELRRNITAYNGQNALQPISALYVTDADLAIRLDSLPLNVQPLDPLQGLGEPYQGRSQFSGCAGLFQVQASPIKNLPNILSPKKPAKKENKAAKRLTLIGALAALLVFAGLVLGFLYVQKLDSKLTRQRMALASLEKDLNDLKIEEKRMEVLKEWESRRINWLDELYDLTERFPDHSTTQVASLIFSTRPITASPNQLAATQSTAPKDKPILPVGTISLAVQTSEPNAGNQLTFGFRNESYYKNLNLVSKGSVGSAGWGKLGLRYEFSADVMNRKPTEYVRKLDPKQLKAPPTTKPEEKPESPKADPKEEPKSPEPEKLTVIPREVDPNKNDSKEDKPNNDKPADDPKNGDSKTIPPSNKEEE